MRQLANKPQRIQRCISDSCSWLNCSLGANTHAECMCGYVTPVNEDDTCRTDVTADCIDSTGFLPENDHAVHMLLDDARIVWVELGRINSYNISFFLISHPKRIPILSYDVYRKALGRTLLNIEHVGKCGSMYLWSDPVSPDCQRTGCQWWQQSRVGARNRCKNNSKIILNPSKHATCLWSAMFLQHSPMYRLGCDILWHFATRSRWL